MRSGAGYVELIGVSGDGKQLWREKTVDKGLQPIFTNVDYGINSALAFLKWSLQQKAIYVSGLVTDSQHRVIRSINFIATADGSAPIC